MLALLVPLLAAAFMLVLERLERELAPPSAPDRRPVPAADHPIPTLR